MATASDEEHLIRASSELRAVISADEDFEILHARWQRDSQFHAGIIRVQHGRVSNIGYIVEMLLFYYEAVEKEAMSLTDEVYNAILHI